MDAAQPAAPAQIQIVPAENGYIIQVMNADGSGRSNPRRVALDREALVAQIKEIAEGLYTKEPPKPPTPPTPPVVPTPPTSDGTPGT